jgi:hypothetical protein
MKGAKVLLIEYPSSPSGDVSGLEPVVARMLGHREPLLCFSAELVH